MQLHPREVFRRYSRTVEKPEKNQSHSTQVILIASQLANLSDHHGKHFQYQTQQPVILHSFFTAPAEHYQKKNKNGSRTSEELWRSTYPNKSKSATTIQKSKMRILSIRKMRERMSWISKLEEEGQSVFLRKSIQVLKDQSVFLWGSVRDIERRFLACGEEILQHVCFLKGALVHDGMRLEVVIQENPKGLWKVHIVFHAF